MKITITFNEEDSLHSLHIMDWAGKIEYNKSTKYVTGKTAQQVLDSLLSHLIVETLGPSV